MIVVVAALIAIASVPLTGGDLRRLGDMRLRRGWLIWLCLLVQVAAGFAGEATPGAGAWLHIVSFAPAGFFVWSNRHLPGARIMAAGGASNLAAIATNGGVMPARPAAWERAGLPQFTDADFANSMPTTDAPLWFLGDIFFIPEGVPFANVFSVGDLALVTAVALLGHVWCRRVPTKDDPELRPAEDPAASSSSMTTHDSV